MKAMIFAAGLGTRLRPLTNSIPKALVKVNNTPLLELCIKNLTNYGFTDIIINIHHFPGQIIHFLESRNYFNINIKISDETDFLLDTGGGLVNAKSFFDPKESFLVHNVDVVSDIDLQNLIHYHHSNNCLSTLAVSDRSTSRYLRFSKDSQLVGWENIKTGERITSREIPEYDKYAFSGIHVISPELFQHIQKKGKFSIIPEYIRLAKDHKIMGFKHLPEKWVDVGKMENIKKAESLLKEIYS